MKTYEDTSAISINRGSSGVISFMYEEGNFEPGEKIDFKVYEERGLENEPVLLKTITVTEETNVIDIELTKEDTTIGNPINHRKIYWYELISSKRDLILGYDENNAKEFILLPKGVDKNA